MNRYRICLKGLFVLLLSGAWMLTAQVSLAPTALFIHDQSNIATMYVNNNSQEVQEISVSFEFSYPGSDDQGNMVTITDDTVSARRYGITGNLRVFPKQFQLQPGAQQVVRFQMKPMPGKPDGIYWSRIIVSSHAAAADVETVSVSEGIGTRINYVFNQNVPAFYVKGNARTGLVAGKVEASLESGKMVALANLTPTGNAPFNGSVAARVLDANNKEICTFNQTVVAYFETKRRIEIPLPEDTLPKGTYSLELTFVTERADIPASDLIQAAPVKVRVPVTVK